MLLLAFLLSIFSGFDFDFRDYLFFLSNLGIIAGYGAAAISLAFAHKLFPAICHFLGRWTRVAGVSFFVLCALTHAEMAFHIIVQEPLLNAGPGEEPIPWHMVLIHAPQAVSILAFLSLTVRDALHFAQRLGNGNVVVVAKVDEDEQ
jgi:hypothetical protein